MRREHAESLLETCEEAIPELRALDDPHVAPLVGQLGALREELRAMLLADPGPTSVPDRLAFDRSRAS